MTSPPTKLTPPPAVRRNDRRMPDTTVNCGGHVHHFNKPFCAVCREPVEHMRGRPTLHNGRPSLVFKVECHGETEDMALDLIGIRGAEIGRGVAFAASTMLDGGRPEVGYADPDSRGGGVGGGVHGVVADAGGRGTARLPSPTNDRADAAEPRDRAGGVGRAEDPDDTPGSR